VVEVLGGRGVGRGRARFGILGRVERCAWGAGGRGRRIRCCW
jgi:hypothetical protein